MTWGPFLPELCSEACRERDKTSLRQARRQLLPLCPLGEQGRACVLWGWECPGESQMIWGRAEQPSSALQR